MMANEIPLALNSQLSVKVHCSALSGSSSVLCGHRMPSIAVIRDMQGRCNYITGHSKWAQ